jgi:hypothetical protein
MARGKARAVQEGVDLDFALLYLDGQCSEAANITTLLKINPQIGLSEFRTKMAFQLAALKFSVQACQSALGLSTFEMDYGDLLKERFENSFDNYKARKINENNV